MGCNGTEYRLLNFDHKAKFIYSSYSATDNGVYQSDFKIFDFNPQSGSFSLDSVASELFKVERKDFFKESTPDSLLTGNHFFRITRAKRGIAECQLDFPWWIPQEQLEEAHKWLKGNTIYFDFVDGTFTRSEPYFDN